MAHADPSYAVMYVPINELSPRLLLLLQKQDSFGIGLRMCF